MGDVYFSGYLGRMVIDGFPDDVFTLTDWNYVYDKGLVEITNSLSFGTNQFIGNLRSGTISANGYVTERLMETVFNDDPNDPALRPGLEAVFNLYFEYGNTDVGFTEIPTVIDELDFSMTVDGTGTFSVKARISEPRI
jgi:hypothetical protein